MFPRPEDIDALMVYNWTHLVKPTDTILHLGDIGFFKTPEQSAFLRDLPGEKFIVPGNHDRQLTTAWFADHGFTEIEAPTFELEGVEISCTHYPQYDLRPNQASCHGHCHSNPRHSTGKHLDMSVELWHYCPVSAPWAFEKLVWSSRINSMDRGPRNVRRPKT